MDKSVSRVISEFAFKLKYDDLTDEVIHAAKRFLYDSIGCAFGAFHVKDVNIIRDIYKETGGRKEATVIAFGDKIPAINAAFLNSLMIRSLDFNDIYWKEDPSHPSDLIPAVLSTAESVAKNMKDVIVGIVLAYEFEQRLCEFAVPGIRERKWHHATLTQFVSPVAAGKILDLTVDEMVNSIGISASHNYSVGSSAAGKLSMMKNTVDPLAVQSGVMAAKMAKKGYTGPENIFEGKEGFMDCFFGWDVSQQKNSPQKINNTSLSPAWEWNIDKLVGGLGENYKIKECGMKAFPTEALTHTHISAALEVVKSNKILYDEIAAISVTTTSKAYDILLDPQKYKPESRETADHSLPFCIAAAVIDGEVTVNSFTEKNLHNRKLFELMNKIKGEASIEFDKMFPEKQPSKVTIKTSNGKEYSKYLEYPKGDSHEPMTGEDLDKKFISLTDGLLNTKQQKEIKNMIFNCEKFNARTFMNALVI